MILPYGLVQITGSWLMRPAMHIYLGCVRWLIWIMTSSLLGPVPATFAHCIACADRESTLLRSRQGKNLSALGFVLHQFFGDAEALTSNYPRQLRA